MKNKTLKFLLKMARLFPIGLVFFAFILMDFNSWSLSDGIHFYNLAVPIVLATMVSFGFIFWNLFDYEKFNGMLFEDFLESTHTTSVNNTEENWNVLREIMDMQLINIKTHQFKSNIIEIETTQNLTDSILTIERKAKEIVLKIERKRFKYLPDNAVNYRTLNKILERTVSGTNRLSTIG